MRTAFVALCLMCSAAAPAAEGSHVTATLLTDGARLEPGAKVRLGVRLEMDPGWHVYWSNPGDAGLATEVTLDLPDGWRAGEIAWPVPVRFEQPGGIEGYGYEGEVVLVREIRLPDRVPGGAVVPVTASWLACRDVCVLGEARLELELPATAAAAAAGVRVLDRWLETVPECGGDPPFAATVKRGAGAGEMTAWLRWDRPVEDVAWFPDALEDVRVESARSATRAGLTRIDLALRPTAGAELPPSVPSVVAWTGGDGVRRGSCLEIDLRMQ